MKISCLVPFPKAQPANTPGFSPRYSFCAERQAGASIVRKKRHQVNLFQLQINKLHPALTRCYQRVLNSVLACNNISFEAIQRKMKESVNNLRLSKILSSFQLPLTLR